MKKLLLLTIIVLSVNSIFSQVGIGTASPDPSAILEIESNTKGVLLPKLSDTERNGITSPQNGLLIFNTDSNTLEINTGTTASPVWKALSLTPNHFLGKFIISGTGNITITGIPFKPSMVKFSAYANVESANINSDNGVGNNNNQIPNAFGNMTGYAIENGVSIDQQVIYNGGSGNSINDISRYASDSHSIGLRYSNQNGNNLGETTASVTSFTNDGFVINVDSHADDILVIFEVHK